MFYCIVIVGGGVGGLEFVICFGCILGKCGKVQVILVDVNFIYIWKFLLYEVVVGLFNFFEDELNYVVQVKWNYFEFQFGCMQGLDCVGKWVCLVVLVDENGVELVFECDIVYDILVIVVGSIINDFGIEGVVEYCIFFDICVQVECFYC